MLQTFIITLREGVEAALVIAIAVAYIQKIGQQQLLRAVYRAAAAAVFASIAVAWLVSKLGINEDAYGGWTQLVSAVFVLSMVIWMNRHARGVKGEIETGLQKSSTSESSGWGIFLFVFLMIFREGVETVLLLWAVRLDTSSVLQSLGALLGVALAILFGVSFVRGTIRINLRSFFKMTTAILMVVVVQLFITGLHELSESQILPSSPREMALIGPIVSNETFFFVAILAMAGVMILMEWRRRRENSFAGLEGAALRKARWSAQRERLWMTASCLASGVFILAITAEFLYAKASTGLSAATPVAVVNGEARIPVADVTDGHLHRYSVESDGTSVRIIVIERPDKTIRAAFDACEICGSQGFFQKGPNVICRNCASAIFIPTIGVRGGCNPIPLPSKVEGGDVVIDAAKLLGGTRYFRNASN